ncbi:hypothetical protein [Actinomycetospora aeridis]|uniref:Uncharacterized protein n=1 Tax=Actinomycetospora aeridis TaxID=3129231 RepID=A0ABU8N489_9PSEU
MTPENTVSTVNTVAALRAHENARLPVEAYDGGARPAAARARDADPAAGPRAGENRR